MTASLAGIIGRVEALSLEERRALLKYLQEELEEAEAVRLTDERWERVKSGASQTYSHEEVWARFQE